MADSDGEYHLSDDEMQIDGEEQGYGTRGARRAGGRDGGGGRERRAWERSMEERAGGSVPLLREGADGRITANLERVIEGRKRKRLRQDTQPFQRGIIRHLLLIIDLSSAMLEKDFRPNRFLTILTYAQQYVREFFEQNPISQLSVLGMHDGICIRISELSGNPNDHIAAIQALRPAAAGGPGRKGDVGKEPRGSPSLQNALEMARAALYHTPSHGTREVIIILGALLSLDPGDIHQTIRACARDRLRVGVIGLSGRLKICQEIVARTNSGDDSGYTVALDQQHFRELLMSTTTPPVMRSEIPLTGTAISNGVTATGNPASLLQMSFPSRFIEPSPTLCACHGHLTRGGYACSRCKAKVCSLPTTCPSCRMTLILSTHLARSYHHLFPLRNWREVSWREARRKGSVQCKACMSPFPSWEGHIGENGEQNGENGGVESDTRRKKEEEGGASESSRYECESCGNHFCIDCDLFCHEVVHNCPGCLGMVHNG